MCLLLSVAQVEGTAIPEAVLVEGVVPEAEVTTGAASEPAEAAAPAVTEEVCDDALPGDEHGRSRPLAGDPRCGADPFGTDVGGCND
jgi:hypothetical protein